MSSLLTTYNLLHKVSFETRTQNKSSTAIDNISVDNSSLDSSYTSPLINGLSDHDGQFSIIHNICASKNKISKKQRKRLINSYTFTNFQTLPEQDTWESVYQKPHNNCLFNSFLSTFLTIFEAIFQLNTK